MAQNNNKTISKIIAAAVAVFLVLLVVALIYNIAKLSAANKRLDELKAQGEYLDSVIDENGALIDYCRTPEFIEQYAREYLDMIGRGEIPIEVK